MALEQMLFNEWTAGETFELYGPKNYSTAELAEMVDREIVKKRHHINVPKRLLKPIAHYLNKFLWWPIMSADEVEMEFHDQVIDPTAKTFKDLGIQPADISNLTFEYLVSAPPGTTKIRLTINSKNTAAGSTRTSRRPQSVRSARRRSITMFWILSSLYIHMLKDFINHCTCSYDATFIHHQTFKVQSIMATSLVPILFLKNHSPNDAYAAHFSRPPFVPIFVPVLEHRLRPDSLDLLTDSFRSGAFAAQYDAIVFTSQRAVEVFGDVMSQLDGIYPES